jgi:hypothetical protein
VHLSSYIFAFFLKPFITNSDLTVTLQMATIEVTPLLSSELRKSSRLKSKEKPSYTDTIPANDDVVVLKKRGRPKKENLARKTISSKSPRKMGLLVNCTDEVDSKPKKVKKVSPRKKAEPPKKKPRLDSSHRKTLLEGTITEDLAEVNSAFDPLPIAVKSSKTRVKETLRAFTSHYLHFVQVNIFCLLQIMCSIVLF